MKIISRGQARKNETDSRREFPGSRILADLWLDHIDEFIELIRRAGHRIWVLWGCHHNCHHLWQNPKYKYNIMMMFNESCLSYEELT